MQTSRLSSAALKAILQESETAALAAPHTAAVSLRRLLRTANPSRRKVPSLCGAGKIDVAKASPAELLAALRADLETALRLDPAHGAIPPYKAAEKLFREPSDEAQQPAAHTVVGVADAVAAGAVDFTAAVRDPRTYCIMEPGEAVSVLAESLSPLPRFVPRGGVFGLVGFEGFYIMPAALNSAQVEYWVRRVCHDFIEPPNRRNIDAALDPDASNTLLAAAAAPASSADAASAGGSATCASSGTQPLLLPPPAQPSHPLRVSRGAEYSEEKEEERSTQDSEKEGCGAPTASGAAVHPGPGSVTSPTFATRLWERHLRGSSSSSSGHRLSDASSAASASASASALPLLRQVAWSTLGLQYDWTARAYHLRSDPDFAEHEHGGSVNLCDSAVVEQRGGRGGGCGGGRSRWSAPFPPDLHAWAADVARVLHAAVEGHWRTHVQPSCCGDAGAEATSQAAWGLPLAGFDAQAGIVNVYHPSSGPKTPMGGHSDNMERTWARPVVSVSMGCSGACVRTGSGDSSWCSEAGSPAPPFPAAAVFLLGGATKEAPPVPLLLRSGDVMVLSGRVRTAIHGVARAFAGTAPAELFSAPLAPAGHSGAADSYRAWCPRAGLTDAAGGPPAQAPHEGIAPAVVCECCTELPPEEAAAFADFMRDTRINFNLRQVVEVVDPATRIGC